MSFKSPAENETEIRAFSINKEGAEGTSERMFADFLVKSQIAASLGINAFQFFVGKISQESNQGKWLPREIFF